MRHHRIEPQPARVFAGDRRADDARGVADDERHLLGGAQRRRDDQIALAFAVVVIGDDDEFAMGKGLQNFLDRIGHFEGSRFGAGSISRTLQARASVITQGRTALAAQRRQALSDLSKIATNQEQGRRPS